MGVDPISRVDSFVLRGIRVHCGIDKVLEHHPSVSICWV